MEEILEYRELNFGYKTANVDGTNEIIVKSPNDLINEVVFQQLRNARILIDLLEVIKIEHSFATNISLSNDLRN